VLDDEWTDYDSDTSNEEETVSNGAAPDGYIAQLNTMQTYSKHLLECNL